MNFTIDLITQELSRELQDYNNFIHNFYRHSYENIWLRVYLLSRLLFCVWALQKCFGFSVMLKKLVQSASTTRNKLVRDKTRTNRIKYSFAFFTKLTSMTFQKTNKPYKAFWLISRTEEFWSYYAVLRIRITLFTDLSVNISTPVIERTKDAVKAVLDNVKELGTSKFLWLLCEGILLVRSLFSL